MGIWQLFATVMTAVLLSSTNLSQGTTLVKLDRFLQSKGSPLPAGELIKYDNWEMIVALSAAESSYGQHTAGSFNAWGIKDFRAGSPKFGGTRDFGSWSESIQFTSELLYKYDPQNGQPSAWGMVRAWKYVRPYEHWVNNVNYALYDLNQNVLA